MINNLATTINELISDLEKDYTAKRRGYPYLNWNRLNPQEPLIRGSFLKGREQ